MIKIGFIILFILALLTGILLRDFLSAVVAALALWLVVTEKGK